MKELNFLWKYRYYSSTFSCIPDRKSKNSHIVFSNDLVLRCSLTRLKSLEIREREVIINFLNIMQPWKNRHSSISQKSHPSEHPTIKANLEINISSSWGTTPMLFLDYFLLGRDDNRHFITFYKKCNQKLRRYLGILLREDQCLRKKV